MKWAEFPCFCLSTQIYRAGFSQVLKRCRKGCLPLSLGSHGPPGMMRVKLWGGISCARHPLPTPSPLPAHPAPFSSLLPGSCLAFPFQFWALTLSFSWKIRHMENDAPRPKESISFASVACGLENSGAELLDSLVCLLPHSHSGPLVGGDFVHHLPSPPLPPHNFAWTVRTPHPKVLASSRQSSLIYHSLNIHCVPTMRCRACPSLKGQGRSQQGSAI